MARRLLTRRGMRALGFVAAGLGLLSMLSGCTSRACTSELRGYRIEMTRDVPAASSPAAPLRVEACVAAKCKGATTRADGTLDFDAQLGFDGPTSGSVTPTDPGTSRLVLIFSVPEGESASTTPVTFRVLDASGAKLHDAAADIQWDDDECHSAPVSEKI